MGDWLQEYIDQLNELWQKLDKRARIIIVTGSVAVIAALVFLIIWGGNADYEPLFTDLTGEDASAIINRLEERGISYRLSGEGNTVLVPAENIHEARLDLAGEGLPSHGVVGFEIFDESQFGTTDFERKVNFYRALGGELSRSIRNMEGIDFARVQISAPEDSLFVEDEKLAEASVLLRLNPGRRLDENQVRAIRNLVASSVQGLNPENVTIVDTAGNLLSQNGSSSNDFYDGEQTAQQFSIQQQFEAGLQRDLEAMLTRVLGPGNFAVQVNALLNFDHREEESKTYIPVVDEEGIVRSEEQVNEAYEGTEQLPEGVPGTEENLPQYEEEDGAGASSYERSDVVTNYEISERIERHQYAPGEVERLSVAIMVDGEVPEEDIEKIRDSVQAAIGYNPDRGDNVTVTGMAFDESLEQELAAAEAAAEAMQRRNTYIYTGLIAFILILIFVVFIIIRRRTEPSYPEGQAVDVTVGEEAEEEIAAASELSEEEKKRQKMKEELTELVTDQPEETAQLLKSWLLED